MPLSQSHQLLWVSSRLLTGGIVLTSSALRGRVTSQISCETLPLLRSMYTFWGSPSGRSSPLQIRTICAWVLVGRDRWPGCA